jgi:hypothetical protein
VRIFVTGPGRCGTVTFAAACKDAHLSCEGRAMTAAHESLMGQEPGWTYPDDHVEAEPRLLWQIHDLLREYPDARWVILHRDHDALVESWAERVPTMAAWSRLALFTGTISPDTIGLFLDPGPGHAPDDAGEPGGVRGVHGLGGSVHRGAGERAGVPGPAPERLDGDSAGPHDVDAPSRGLE